MDFSPMLERRAAVKSHLEADPFPVEIPFLQFPGLSRVEGLRHAVYTRLGGSSRPPYKSLNISFSVGDDAEHVAINRRIILQAFGTPRLQEMEQVHGDRILVLNHEQSGPHQVKAPAVDAAVTNLPGVALMVKRGDSPRWPCWSRNRPWFLSLVAHLPSCRATFPHLYS